VSDPLAIGTASVSAVRAETARLREFFAQQRPAIGRELGPVTLEPEAPERVRVFWETFGWTDDLEKHAALSHPDMASGRAKVQELLAEMREDEVELQGELPQRYRLVNVDRDGIGFAVTNEDGDPTDPPVVAVISDTGAVVQEHSSYLNYCANQVVFASFAGWPTLSVTLSSYELLAAAEAPWPLLSPATRRLTPDVWLFPRSGLVVAPGRQCGVAFTRLEALTRWLMELPEGLGVSVPWLPGKTLGVDSLAEVEPLLDPGARSFLGPQSDERLVVGTIEGRPVMARQHGERCQVSTALRHSAWLAARLAKKPEPAAAPPTPATATHTPRPLIRDEELVALDDLLAELCP